MAEKGTHCACRFDEEDEAIKTCAFHDQMVDCLKRLVVDKDVNCNSHDLIETARECLEEGGYLRG